MSRRPGRRSTSGPGPKPHWLAGLASALATLAGLVLLVGLLCVWIYKAPGPRARQGPSTTVILRKGSHSAEIATDLERAGVISSAPIFMAASQVSGAARGLKAGEYAFASRVSLQQVLRKLRAGDVVHHKVTVPEGMVSRQVVDILNRCEVLEGSVPAPPEGTVLPDTYDVVRGEQRASVLQRMMDADDRLLAQLWRRRRPGLPYVSAEQAVILASLVEKETALASERPRVAGVYLTRLRQGMKLDSDPTVIYGLTAGLPLGHGLRVSELEGETPYNTYRNLGLPPTPIDNPGRAALAAAMDPTPGDEVYFVANGTGGHVFAKSLAEHERNVARWRRIERQRQLAATTAPETSVAHPTLLGVPGPRPLEHR